MNDAWFFVGVFAFIFLIWVATGGPSHPLSFAGPYLSEPAPLGTGTYIGLPSAPFGIGDSEVTLANPDTGAGSSYSSTGGALSGVTLGPPSSYSNEVTLTSSVYNPGSSNPENEYVRISLASDAPAPVDISGWALESAASGNTAIIPEGTEVPMSGSIQAVQPIILQPGDTAIVTSGESPIGASFRENECIGYYGEFQTFSPPLPSCPDPATELENYYGPNYIRDNACINYVDRLESCTLSITPPPNMTSACDNFLENHLSYAGCVDTHENDANFKDNTWRIYLGRSNAMWRKSNEVVELVDQNGDVVDAFSY